MPSLQVYLDDPIYKDLIEEIRQRREMGEKIGKSTPIQEALRERYKEEEQ